MYVSKLFRAYRLYNYSRGERKKVAPLGVSKLFRAYRLYNGKHRWIDESEIMFQSSFELTGYITMELSDLATYL